MRQVWKPFACAEMPRIACIATGRPVIVACSRPQASVQGWCNVIACSNATSASSRASRRIVSASTPQVVATASGAYWADMKRSANSWNAGTAARPSASVYLPTTNGAMSIASARAST